MMNTVGYILNLITLAQHILTILISLIILILIVHHLYSNRVDADDKLTFIFGIQIYLFLLVCISILIAFSTQTLLGDLYEWNFNTSSCVCMGYVFPIFLGGLFWTFFNQAFFRYCRIAYPQYRFLQQPLLYIILVFVELIFVAICFSPFTVWNEIVYLPNEFYCYAFYKSVRGLMWLLLNDYGVPLFCSLLIYLRIILFLRQQPHNQTRLIRQRQQRDLIVTRRILIMACLLVAVGTPTIILALKFHITHIEELLFYRIAWLSVGLSLLALSLSQTLLTPQLRQIILKNFHVNQILPSKVTTVCHEIKRESTV